MRQIASFVERYSQHFQVHRRNMSHRAHEYIKGLLQAERRNMEKMAEVVTNTDEQALQQFLSDSPWDYQAVMDQVAGDVNRLLGGRDSALLLDETSIVKKGRHSVGVARQWCGRLGKVDNCQVGVFSALSKGSEVCLVNAQLFLPESWHQDARRCHKARVPKENQRPQTKSDIALSLVKQAKAQGLDYGWVGADSLYGRDRSFQRTLDELGEVFMLDIPSNFRIYEEEPQFYRPEPAPRGRKPKRIKTDATAIEVQDWIKHQTFRRYTYRAGTKGPLTVEATHQRIWVWDGQSAQARCWHLVVRKDSEGCIKYSLSNAPAKTSLHRLLYMQGQRHFIERSFQDAKSHLGLDQYQARNWNAWHHHMALIMMSMVFLLEQRQAHKKEYPLLTVADMVFIFSHVLPSRTNGLDQLLEIVEQRHRKRQKDIERRYASQQPEHINRWANSG